VSRWPGIAIHNATLMQGSSAPAVSVQSFASRHKMLLGSYSGYFSDLAGHLWEVAYIPHFRLSDDGHLQLPD
jgi:hypothetical protein